MQNVNAVHLTGSVVDVLSQGVIIETKEVTPKAEYKETHFVATKAAKKLLKKGNRLSLFGQIVTQDGETFIQALDNTVKAATSTTDSNIAKFVGKAVRSLEHYGRKGTKKAFANILLVGDNDQFARGVAFDYLANALAGTLKKNCIAQLCGRIRHRKYEDPETGEERSALEIVADQDSTKVLMAAEENDPFADLPGASSKDIERMAKMAEIGEDSSNSASSETDGQDEANVELPDAI